MPTGRNGSGPVGVRVWRGSEVESLHRVHVAVARDGRLVARHGEPETRAFMRSAAKPIQVLPLVEEGLVDALGLTDEELAVAAASHNAEPFHLAAVGSLLEKAGLEPGQLQCGPHEPMYPPAAEALRAAGLEPTPMHNNCSGKHAAMLATCRAKGWPLETYLDPEHPLQRRIRGTLAELAGVDEARIGVAVDGCGAPTFALPVVAMATAFAALADADARRDGERAQAVGRVLDAMAAHPEYVAGTDRLCTALMACAGARVVAKTGAEGVYCAVLRGAGGEPRGLALKVADGAHRAQDVALVALLDGLGALPADDETLSSWRRAVVTNRAGRSVGRIDARLPIEAA